MIRRCITHAGADISVAVIAYLLRGTRLGCDPVTCYVSVTRTAVAGNTLLQNLRNGGTNLFADALCIPKNAAQKEAAELYINFMCEPQVAAAVAEYIGYSTPNSEALALLPDEVKNNPISYPADDFLNANTEMFRNLTPAANKLMQDLWTDIKSEN